MQSISQALRQSTRSKLLRSSFPSNFLRSLCRVYIPVIYRQDTVGRVPHRLLSRRRSSNLLRPGLNPPPSHPQTAEQRQNTQTRAQRLWPCANRVVWVGAGVACWGGGWGRSGVSVAPDQCPPSETAIVPRHCLLLLPRLCLLSSRSRKSSPVNNNDHANDGRVSSVAAMCSSAGAHRKRQRTQGDSGFSSLPCLNNDFLFLFF